MNSRLVLLFLSVAGQLGAQAIVRGAVVTEQGQRIAGVELQVASLRKSVRTDSAGEYKMLLPPGRYRLTTRAIGFFSLSDSIEPEANVELIHDFTLTSIAQLLDTVEATAPRKPYMGSGLQGFEERRKSGLGRYLSEEELDKQGNRLLSDVLRKVPGLLVRPGRGNAYYASSARNGASARSGCLVAVFLDGLPIYNGGRAGSNLPVDLNLFSPKTLSGVEFYASAATLPVQFRDGTGCGMLMLWTRER